MQNQIEQIGNNIIDELKYDNGVVYLSISGSARLVGVNESSIRRAVQNGHSMPKLLAQCGVEVRHSFTQNYASQTLKRTMGEDFRPHKFRT